MLHKASPDEAASACGPIVIQYEISVSFSKRAKKRTPVPDFPALLLNLTPGYGAGDPAIAILQVAILLVRAPPDLAYVNPVLLQIDPEEFGVTDEIRNLDPHGFKFLEGEVLNILPLFLHPFHRYPGFGLDTIVYLFHGI